MRLMHYTGKSFTFDKEFTYQQATPEHNSGAFWYFNKPDGFWVSIEDSKATQKSWKTHCKDLNMTEWLDYTYEVIINKSTNYLIIDSLESLIHFSIKYIDHSTKNKEYNSLIENISPAYVDWNKVVKDYQGIFIIPYPVLDISFSPKSKFYPVWYEHLGVPSGCIWDLNTIKTVKEIS